MPTADTAATAAAAMNTRQQIQAILIVVVAFLAFASYHAGTGNTGWIQWTTLDVMLLFSWIFDLSFTDDSSFLFDPDADNWRRKTEAGMY